MNTKTKIKTWLYLFILGLIFSGITAFPLEWEFKILNDYFGIGSDIESTFPALSLKVSEIYLGLKDTNSKYHFMAYGTDWLAFAHLMLAILFIGPLKNPIKNIWVIDFGIISCLLVIPFAMICGHVREIPIFWRLIDCSFGVLGIIPLLIVKYEIRKLIIVSNSVTGFDKI